MSNDLTLYKLSEDYILLSEKLLDSDDVGAELSFLEGELKTKAINVAMVIKNFEAAAEAKKAAEKSMAESRKALENKAEAIRKYLLDNMLSTNILKLECPEFALSVRNNPPAVNVTNANVIPTEYFDAPPMPDLVLNKNRLKDDLKNGVVVPGAELTVGKSLQIK